MAKKADLQDWLLAALNSLGGKSPIVPVCCYVWKNYEDELRGSGKLFLTWQYDIRWAATALRKRGKMKAADDSPRGVWELP